MRGCRKYVARIVLSLFALASISGVISFLDNGPHTIYRPNDTRNDTLNDTQNEAQLDARPEDLLKVHFIDVGQADCILAELPGNGAMMIDAGNRDDAGLIIEYIRRLGINKIDILVGTHPHEDHIGGMAEIVDEMGIGDVYLPKVGHTTYTFSNLLNALDKKGLRIKTAEAGAAILPPGSQRPGDITIEVLSPPKYADYEDLNDWSAVIRLRYAGVSFLFMGDVGFKPEKDILAGNFQIKSDVLKVAHHGSRYSTSTDFLNRVMPDFCVIFAEQGNEYGLPASETIERISVEGVRVLRTDERGSIIFTTDGTSINVETSR